MLDLTELKKGNEVIAGIPWKGGSVLRIKYLTRTEVEELRESCKEEVYEQHRRVERLNKDKLYRAICHAAVKGWEGIVVEGEPLEYSKESIDFLFDKYTGFDLFVYEAALEFYVIDAIRKMEAKKNFGNGSGPAVTTPESAVEPAGGR